MSPIAAARGRVDDVGEEHSHEHAVDVGITLYGRAGDELGDRVEHGKIAAGLAGHVEVAGKLDEASPRDVLGEVAPVSHRDDRIAGSVHNEGRDAHGTERVPDVHVDVVMQDRRGGPG